MKVATKRGRIQYSELMEAESRHRRRGEARFSGERRYRKLVLHRLSRQEGKQEIEEQLDDASRALQELLEEERLEREMERADEDEYWATVLGGWHPLDTSWEFDWDWEPIRHRRVN